MRVFSKYIASANDAGPKAKVDIENILKNKYNAKIYTYKEKDFKNGFFVKLKKTLFTIFHFSFKDITIIQLPYLKADFLFKHNKNVYGILHDISYFRSMDKNDLASTINSMNNLKGVIIHNNAMKDFLESNGLKTKTICLEFFDYIASEDCKAQITDISNGLEVVYPGNWDRSKAEFLYDLNENDMNYKINLYGPNVAGDQLENKNIIFKGMFKPDELIQNLEGNIGLVWAGMGDDSDSEHGEKLYNKYNTPHKLSCFLAANLPVIVWDKSAIAEVVKKYNIGYLISNINDINKLDLKDYEEKKRNAEIVGKKIREGYFTNKAIESMIK